MEINKKEAAIIALEIFMAFMLGFTISRDIDYDIPFTCYGHPRECPVAETAVWKPAYENILEDIHLKDFVINEYDCSNKSWELVHLLKEEGYNARIVCGWRMENLSAIGHAWAELTLYLDPTSGMVMQSHPIYSQYSKSEKICTEALSEKLYYK